MSMIKIACLGLATTMLILVLGKSRKEYAFVVTLTGCLILFFFGISKVQAVADMLQKLENYIGVDHKYIEILLKMVGIAYLAELSSNLCKDADQNAVAGQIDMVAKISMLLLSLPILQSLLETMGDFAP